MSSRSKAYNDALAMLDRTFLSPRTLAYPSKIYIAVSVACDIRCPYCPRQYYSTQIDHGMMSLESFMKVAPSLAYASFCGLFGLGEPFLHRQFLEFLRIAKEAGAYAATSTHGMSLKPEVIERLIELGLDELAISIDAPNAQLFEFLRAGAKFDTVISQARLLRDRKRALGRAKPQVNIGCAVSRHNVRILPEMVALAKDLGAGRLVFTDLIIVDPNNKDLSVSGSRLMAKYLDKARKEAARLGQETLYFPQNPFPWEEADAGKASGGEAPGASSSEAPGASGGGAQVRDLRSRKETPILECAPRIVEARDQRFGCAEAWGALMVERNGDAKPCCYIADIFGNAFETSPAEVESGAKKARLREALASGQLPGPCRDCRNLVHVSPEHIANAFSQAARAAESLSGAERREMEAHIEQYRALSPVRLREE
ncbi:MAG: radical SAM/SPASM domain-containing protein [Candidatus Sumerlaeota bacterium]|nr:radical SAM/SPASM domain-containing protein [Candidatus Sumerlaeota bacterium]